MHGLTHTWPALRNLLLRDLALTRPALEVDLLELDELIGPETTPFQPFATSRTLTSSNDEDD